MTVERMWITDMTRSLLRTHRASVMVGVVMAMVIGGCNLVGDPEFPAGTPDPETFNTPDGALALYRNAVTRMGTALQVAIRTSGWMTDEFSEQTPNANSIDVRIFDGSDGAGYVDLQKIRAQSTQAIGVFSEYAANLSPAYRSTLYAFQGYAVLLLADFFCSGVPLSTVDYGHNFTYRPGSTTPELYRHAIALFDTAALLGKDSIEMLSLAQVGKARAYMGLEMFDSAMATVTEVPRGFTYTVPVIFSKTSIGSWITGVADRKGETGLAFRSSSDPRIVLDSVYYSKFASGGTTYDFGTVYWPRKYALGFTRPAVLADWIEARLIVAEAELRTDGSGSAWLDTLNMLRQSAVTPSLADLPDPGSGPIPIGKTVAQIREDLLFAERGFWLFARGIRQGDLRRMIRQYDRTVDEVYPTGLYPYGRDPNLRFSTDVTIPVPNEERTNPLFKGCLSRDP